MSTATIETQVETRRQEIREGIDAIRLVTKDTFDGAVEIVLRHYSYETIARKWNAFHLGRPSKAVTMKRWMSTSPVESKNRLFEVFIVGMASNWL